LHPHTAPVVILGLSVSPLHALQPSLGPPSAIPTDILL
jgi:hypothetical protein